MEFRSAGSRDEALGWLAELGDGARVLAGGTDVMVQYLRGEIEPAVLVHIERLDELREISHNGTTRIGALATHRMIGSDPYLAEVFPAIAEAATTVGGWQTQEVGTIGGNLCNASPAADLIPPLIVAGAVLNLDRLDEQRAVPVDEFAVGRRSTVLRPDELLTSIDLEPPPPSSGAAYLKLGRRSAMEVAIVGLAAALSFGEDGSTVVGARFAVGSVANLPLRVPEAEAALIGSGLEPEAVAEAGRILTDRSSPIDDARATADYRKRMISPLLARAVAVCRERAAS